MSVHYQLIKADGTGLDQEAIVLAGLSTAGETRSLGTIRVQCLGTEQAPTALRMFAYAAAGADQTPQTGKWVEARVGAGAWTAIGGATYLALTPPAVGGYVDVEMRLVVPAGLTTQLAAAVQPWVQFW